MKKMRRYIAVWVALAAAIAAILFLGDGEKEKAYRVASGVVWHTVYNVTYESGRDLGDSIVAVTSAIDRSASMYNRQSVLSRINAGVTDQADATVARLLLRSQEISGETGGAFDPTVAPLMRLWKTQTDSAALPTKADIDSVMQFVGMGKVGIDAAGRVTKVDSRLSLDFSAIAKGLGCDEVARMLERNGVENYVVEIGGEVVARGVNKRGEPWAVAVDMPVANADSVVHTSAMVLHIDSGAVATSGNYRNYKVVDGRKIAHIIDPATGCTAQSDLLSATVVAANCMDADAYATALMVMGLQRAQKFAVERADCLAVVLIYADEADGSLQVWRSPGVARYEK